MSRSGTAEVAKPERLVFTFAWEESGERGLQTLVTVIFIKQGGTTKMTLQQLSFQSLGERKGHDERWTSTFERLAEFLRGMSNQ